MEDSALQQSSRKVLVALDEGEASANALSWALDNLLIHDSQSRQHSDSLLLLYVQPHQQLVHGYYMTPEVQESVRQHHDEICHKIFERAKALCKEKNVETFETMLLYGDPREAICDAVVKLRPNLLVMGSHGYGAFKRLFLGSVSDYCAHHAECPILIVRN